MPITCIIDTDKEIFWDIPDGKPNRKLAPGSEEMVVRPKQKEGTCFYYATRLLADRVGQHASVQETKKRMNEKLFSSHRKKMTRLDNEMSLLASDGASLLGPELHSLLLTDDSNPDSTQIEPQEKLILELNLLSKIISDPQMQLNAKPSAEVCRQALRILEAINNEHSLYTPLHMQALKTLLEKYPSRYNQNQTLGEYVINYYRLTAAMKVHEELLTAIGATGHTPERYPFNRETEALEVQEGLLRQMVNLELIKKQGFDYLNCGIDNNYSVFKDLFGKDAFPNIPMPPNDFSLFRKQLKEKGPFIIGGAFGESFYKNPPKQQPILFAGRPVFYWPPGDYINTQDPASNVSWHAIVVVGAKEYQTEDGQTKQIIFYHDPNTKSDPKSTPKTPVYSISFKALCERNVSIAPGSPRAIVKRPAA